MHQYSGSLRQGLQNQHSRHDGRTRKMALEKGLVHSYVFQPNDFILFQIHLDDTVNEQKRVTVGKYIFDFLCIEHIRALTVSHRRFSRFPHLERSFAKAIWLECPERMAITWARSGVPSKER